MVKVISLSNEAYNGLKSEKIGKESFSDVVVRVVIKKKPRLSDLAGALKGRKEWDKIKKEIYENRKRAKMREIRFD